MEIEITKKILVNAFKIKVDAGVRYWQDSTINGVKDNDCEIEGSYPLMPCAEYIGEQNRYLRSQNHRWRPIINIDQGKIENWIAGTVADIHYKVCDDFKCEILEENGNVICEYEDYVPSIMCPKDYGYGDYIIMHIDENGIIENWDKYRIEELI